MSRTITSHKRVSAAFSYLFCAVLALLVLIPLYVALTGGLKSMGQLMIAPLEWPHPLEAGVYGDLLAGKIGAFWSQLFNSLLMAAGTVLLTLILGTMAGFALARIPFRASGTLLGYFLLGLLFPLTVAILPLYLQIRTLGLLDTPWGVILPQVAFGLPLSVLLLRGFIKAIPRDLEDACDMDGYGPLGFLWNMVIPLSTPILATVGVITLVTSWNNFFLPLLVFNKAAEFTLPLGVMDFQGQHSTQWNLILGFLTLAMVPAVALFIAAQRYIVAGLTGGAVKG